MKVWLLPLLSLVLVLATCCDDDQPNPEPAAELALHLVTGIRTTDANDQSLGTYGNPNTFPGQVAVFPNPSNGVALVQYVGQATGTAAQLEQVWIFPGTR
ncbi:MAG: hypothetical protein DA408_07550 [Bacteroidetes bacterium]|nr:MAG: hypothetical protein C7N36_15165 [Bacteroidota bacterium]PTM13239.1 MAG: hypothetical protein DA408_07550 [Bacteroidota bacterium]